MEHDTLRELLRGLLEKMACSFSDIRAAERNGSLVVEVETPQSDILIGPHGETLASITYIFRKIIERKLPALSARSISVDINGYRERRAETLRGVAAMLAERARTFRHDVEMDPLPSHERLVIHSFFENHPWIVTESKGEGKFRHVILKYTEKDTAIKADF